MTAAAALQKLLSWMSPAFPVGAFAWSAGLETAIADTAVSDSASMQNWLQGNLRHGSLRTDAVLVAHAHRAYEKTALQELADLCLALAPAAERASELTTVGGSFVRAAAAWPLPEAPDLPDPCPYPVAIGALARAHGIDLDAAILGFLTAAVQSQVSVAVRLVPIGQTDGLRVVAALEPLVREVAAMAATATLEEIGGIAYATDIAQMRHETKETRLFRS
jgi:urease accessory protein